MLRSIILSALPVFCLASTAIAQVQWQARLLIPKTEKSIVFCLEFGLPDTDGGLPSCVVVNGTERISVSKVQLVDGKLAINFPHYDSVIQTELNKDSVSMLATPSANTDAVIKGTFTKRRGQGEWVKMKFVATQKGPQEYADPSKWLGRWRVSFDSSEDPAVGVFRRGPTPKSVVGTFLTTTGDYRFLVGGVEAGKLNLCCFDGAHAFRFEASLDKGDQLTGDFWSSNTWHETWTAVRDPTAALPDAFAETKLVSEQSIGDLAYPDLEGKLTKLSDPRFAGKARIIYVFGSWCPNCHDAAVYFKELESKYGKRGLSILGLAFELTGDHSRDAKQVKKYLDRHQATYPVLIAGLADKSKASDSFPVLDRVRSYPTTIFLDQFGTVRGIHTGFTGPATGDEYQKLKTRFETLIEKILDSGTVPSKSDSRSP